MTFSRVDRYVESSHGVVLKSGRPALGYLCVRGARHPRVARAGPPIVLELSPPLYNGTKISDRGTSERGPQQVARRLRRTRTISSHMEPLKS